MKQRHLRKGPYRPSLVEYQVDRLEQIAREHDENLLVTLSRLIDHGYYLLKHTKQTIHGLPRKK